MSEPVGRFDTRPPIKPARLSEWWVSPLVALWLLCVACGIASFDRYTLLPGSPAFASEQRPQAIGPSHTSGCDELLMVVHPNCPCSRASMSELAALAASCEKPLSIRILFVEPPGLVEDVETTELWHSAQHIPGAALIRDTNGALSHALGATTSGQVYLYDRGGTLRFSGGITDSRGHAGNNLGRSAIEAILHDQSPGTICTPVFGCALW